MNKYLITITYRNGYVKIMRRSDDLTESQRIMEINQFTKHDPEIRSINIYEMIDSALCDDPFVDDLLKGEL